MSISKRFVVKKEAKTDSITYLEYEKLKGYDVKPNSNFQMEDMINVNKMVIINPSLIEKLVDKKCRRTLEKIIKMLSIIYDDDSDDNTPLELALNEIEKFKTIVMNKYKEYMKQEDYKLLLKKLEILKSEVKLRQEAIYEHKSVLENEVKTGRKGR